MNLVYIQGKLNNSRHGSIKSADRSFRFGDGVFERIRMEDGRVFNYNFHEKRLKTGLNALSIKADIKKLKTDCLKIAAKHKIRNGFFRVHISRGEGSRGYLPDAAKPVIIIELEPKLPAPNKAAVICISKVKANVPVKAKTASSINYVMASIEAKKNKCDNAILLDSDGYICECTNANIFFVKNGKISTPKLDMDLIPGSVQNIIMKNFPVKEVKIKPSEMINLDEVFMTNTGTILQNVKEIKGYGKYEVSGLTRSIKEVILNKRNFS